jgi:isochorismate synthase
MALEFQVKLQSAIEKNLPFVLFRKPMEDKIQLSVQDSSNLNRFLFHSFDSSTEKQISDASPLEILVSEFDFDFEIPLQIAPLFQSKTESDYQELIRLTIQSIQNSNSKLKKVVISRKKEIENSSYSVLKTFRNLLDQHQNALVFLWHSPGEETWIGATPELLLSQKGNRVETVSLAGTKLPEALWTEKEFEEQRIVTEFIEKHFQELGNWKVEGPETVQAGKFQHLKSSISAEIKENKSLDILLEKMHPTPALCGMPKQDAFDFIVQNEGYNREFYSGFMGIENSDSKEYFVNLRSAQVFQDKIWVYVGGGITADSNPEKEWKETELKSGTILNALEY